MKGASYRRNVRKTSYSTFNIHLYVAPKPQSSMDAIANILIFMMSDRFEIFDIFKLISLQLF